MSFHKSSRPPAAVPDQQETDRAELTVLVEAELKSHAGKLVTALMNRNITAKDSYTVKKFIQGFFISPKQSHGRAEGPAPGNNSRDETMTPHTGGRIRR